RSAPRVSQQQQRKHSEPWLWATDLSDKQSQDCCATAASRRSLLRIISIRRATRAGTVTKSFMVTQLIPMFLKPPRSELQLRSLFPDQHPNKQPRSSASREQ